mgnify:CR=1 FL=1
METNKLRTDIKEVKRWVKDNQIEAHVSDSFEKAFQSFKEDDDESFQIHFPSFDKKKLTKTLYQVSLSIVCWGAGQYEQECIIVYLRIEYDNKHVIDYKEVFDLDGQTVDDYLKTINVPLRIGGVE